MFPMRTVLVIALASFAGMLHTEVARAAKINGQECVSAVSVQTNPVTGAKTYVCRNTRGNIISGSHVDKAPAPKSARPKSNGRN